jgi:RimJ/RimL family protein N-acetyltransferase
MAHIIHTPRLLLRPLETSDAEQLFAQFNNWNVVRWLSAPPWPYALEDARGFISRQAMNAHKLTETTFAITHEGRLIGGIDARFYPSETPRGGPVLGYWLGEDYWGQGYMTEAARGFLAYAFAANVSDVIYSGVFADNAASLRVQEKLGFVPEGEIMMFAKPRGDHFPHINTVLTRAGFNAAAG